MSFLPTLQAPVILLACWMADAGAEVIGLIRGFDTENLSTTDMCRSISDCLSRIRWLFDEQGAFQVDGHTSYAVKWLRSPRFVAVRGEGKCIGGIDVLAPEHAAMRGEAMSHIRCWVGLAQRTLNA